MLNFVEEKADGESKYLVIFFHGWGSNKEDLIALSGYFKTISPNIHFISVDAPDLCESGFGYQWFSLKEANFEYIENEINKNNSNLDDFISTVEREIRKNNIILKDFIEFQSKRLNIDYDRIILAGFSQGAIMSMYAGITVSKKLCGIVAFSGLFPVAVNDLNTILRTKQKILMLHGEDDHVIPFQYFQYSVDTLKRFDFDLTCYLLENLGHRMDDRCISFAKQFIESIIEC